MRPFHAAIVVIAAVLLVAAGATYLLTQDDGWSITYETDGGTLPDGAPVSYHEGDSFALPVPTRDGYVFMGWSTSQGSSDTVETVEGLSGDIVLYASWIEAVEHSIEYVLDGGTLPEGSVRTFIGGVGAVLPIPEREGMVFAGWFEDPDFTTPVVVLGRDVLEDVTVYACWDEEVPTGTGYVWDVSGEYYNGDIRHTVEGTVREEVLAERDGAYYIQTTSDLTYTWPTGSTTDDSVRGRWSDGAGETLTYVGIGEAGGYTCTVWESEDGTRYWLYHLALQVRAEVEDGTTHIVHQLAEVYTFEPETSFVPDVSAEYPLEVRGAGTVSIGDRLELTAVGEGFNGWYSGGELVTTERTLVVDRVDPTCSYEARSSDGYTVLDQVEVGLGDLGFVDGSVITDWDGNVVTGYGSLEPGYYVVTDATGDVTRYLEFFIEDARVFEHTWTFGGVTYTIRLDMLYSDVFWYTYSDPYGNIRLSLTDPAYVSNYHTVDDGTLSELMRMLSAYGSGMDRTEFARFVLSFVQTIPYVTDEDSVGEREYWKYPLETLWDGGGDCEDSTILYDTLMLMAGYDVAFVLFQDHAMSAVSVDVDGHSLTRDGIVYVFCETTTVSEIGLTSKGHTEDDVYYWCPVVVGSGTDTDKNP